MLQSLLAESRGGLLLRLRLAEAFVASCAAERALSVARETAHLYPDAAAAALSLAGALRAVGNLPAAIAEYQRALRCDPGLEEARIGLGAAWLDAGEAGKALEAWQGCDNNPVLARRIAEAQAVLMQPRSDARYVRHLFDQFAADYDSRMLGQLHYRAPSVISALAEMLGLWARAPLAICDLGCGTGLMGEALRAHASQLDGVDLSPRMLDEARARGIYDQLVCADIAECLAQQERAYDLVTAADTLVYLGDLAPLFVAVAVRLAPHGHFLFTVESVAGRGFALGPKRRWRHSETYLRSVAAMAGLGIAGLMACSPRDEAGKAVEGFAVALSR